MITFAEETLALLLDDKTGTFLPIGKYALEHALVGGVLMDLAFADRIDTDPEQLILIDAAPTGNPMLDRVLKRISDSSETRDTAAWLEIISEEQGESIQEQAIESLIARNPAADAALEQRRLQLAIDANVVTDYTRANGMGGIDDARMAKALEQLAETYEFQSAPDASLYFTDAYLPGEADRMLK